MNVMTWEEIGSVKSVMNASEEGCDKCSDREQSMEMSRTVLNDNVVPVGTLLHTISLCYAAVPLPGGDLNLPTLASFWWVLRMNRGNKHPLDGSGAFNMPRDDSPSTQDLHL